MFIVATSVKHVVYLGPWATCARRVSEHVAPELRVAIRKRRTRAATTLFEGFFNAQSRG
jgi:hypothetical protein